MRIKTNTLGFRLMLLFSAIMIPLLLVLFAAGYYAKDVVLAQVSKSYQNLVNSNLQMIDKSLDDITTNMIDMVDHDENFQRFGRPGLSDSDYYFAQMGLIQRNQAYQAYYHTVDMFYAYSKPNDVLVTSNILGSTEGYMDNIKNWITDSILHPESLEALLYKWTIVRIGGEYYLNRVISDDLTNNAYIGALININSLKSPLNSLNLQAGGDLLFVGNDGIVLSSPSASLGGDFRLPADKMNKNSSFSLSEGHRKLFVVSSQSPEIGINMAIVLPNSELLQGLNDFQTLVNLLPLFVFLILLLYLYIFRRTVIRPILKLLSAIHRIRGGAMETKLPVSNLVEFQSINHAFNSMVEEIGYLKIDVYEERLNAQNAELKHLQTQINPHFFLNTLNIIYQLAELQRYELVKKTVRHLVQYFRFMLQSKRDTITLSQELEHIRNYLEIQKMRYQDSFDFDIRISDELLGACIPSLLIQPFVENAMIHGMSLKGESFSLQISANPSEEMEGLMRIDVQDNGKGILDEKLEELNAPEYAPASEDKHIGIWNVKKRIAMRYGGKARIHLSHNEPKGMRVTMVVPIEYI
ncbi:sensor histidine kinase [Paenibacillus rhizophilus]|uniref:HAMP domain-containing protein n=1 Tax=Paenibacillus rhizophilus TaxID=1850366 RepID=A0A3N9PVY7_9BACL|nr:histidine kinase [Paenibacillus rhizophilus]RQW10582.1 HAMP domain-containing protein [Paenibacillus rhizophilus]